MKEWSQRGYETPEIASRYIEYRPRPPPELVDIVVDYLKEKYDGDLDFCMDVGCGSGQCTVFLAKHFKKVLATDISVSQIEVAKSQNYPSNIEFQVCPAEKCPVEDGSVQLISSTIAAHWFDLPAYFKEVDRILCTNGVVTVSSYAADVSFSHPTKSEELLQALRHVYNVRLKEYWAPGLEHVLNEYANIFLPYENSIRKEIWRDESQTLHSFVQYMTSWCAYNNFCKANGEAAGQELLNEFVTSCQKALETTKDPKEVELTFKRKYFVLMGRKP